MSIFQKKLQIIHIPIMDTTKFLKEYFVFIFLFIYGISNMYSQVHKSYVIPDSLIDKPISYLDKQVLKNHDNPDKILVYLSAVLTKKTINKDTIGRIQALSQLAYYEKKDSKKIKLIEEALAEIKGIDRRELINVHNTAGIIYYDQYRYETALKQYLRTLELSKKYDFKDFEYIAINNIAEIKEDIGKYEEAVTHYKKALAYENSKPIKDSISIMVFEMNLAKTMRYIKKHDSSSFYYNRIINTSFSHPLYQTYIDIATINEGINLFHQQKLTEAKKFLEAGSSQITINSVNQKHYILSQLYLGKINLKLKNIQLGEGHFHKVDSLLTSSKSIIPETREVYEYFFKKYKTQNNLPSQLEVINKLVSLDSTINIRKINTSNILHSEFDVPELLLSREIIIKKLKNTNSTLGNRAILLGVSIFILAFLFAVQYRKHKLYKKRFNELIAKPNLHTEKNVKATTIKTTTPKEINIDERLISKILNQLEDFEKRQLYTKRDVSINSLAKSFSTNTRYLSKVINVYKQKKFIHYINDLRIDYILEELKHNTTLQRYTIKSISEEAGFNTAESFASAFKKKTGLKPSYFIRNIKKKETI